MAFGSGLKLVFWTRDSVEGPAGGGDRGWAEMVLSRNWRLGKPAQTGTLRSGIVKDAPNLESNINIHIYNSTVVHTYDHYPNSMLQL